MDAIICLAPDSILSRGFMLEETLPAVKAALEAGEYTEFPPIPTTLLGDEAAEEMFNLTNNPSRQTEREAKYGRHRSVSCGDIVKVGDDAWVCMSCGWTRL